MTNGTGTTVSAIQVITAVNAVPSAQKLTLFGFETVGDLAQNPDVSPTVTTPTTTDPKLWIIGAVLGPVAFVLLLIFLACFLHYKCRPRRGGPSYAQVHSSTHYFLLFS